MFNDKQLRATITLGASSFNDENNSKIIEGLACEFDIENVAAPDANKCNGKIYGMSIDDIAEITTLAFRPLLVTKRNVLKLEALVDSKWVVVFIGEIETAYGDFNSAPDVALVISAFTGTFANKVAIAPTSVKGETSVAQVLQPLAQQAGYTLDCQVDSSVANVSYSGSIMQQIYQVANSVNAKAIIDGEVIHILAIDSGIEGVAPLITANSGMIGYPTFTNQGISLMTEYNSSIKMQGHIIVESIVPKASGEWRVVKLNHKLTANLPSGGDWKSIMECVYV